MGCVRDRQFDAVIGVGGKRPWPKDQEIAERINWIGISPKEAKTGSRKLRGRRVRFECFVLFEEKGPKLETIAPKLFNYMYRDNHVRAVMSQSLSAPIQKEVRRILRLTGRNKKRFTAE